MPLEFTCERCGKTYLRPHKRRRNPFCSLECCYAPRALTLDAENGIAYVPLGTGDVAVIDIEDAEEIGKFNWSNRSGYAVRVRWRREGPGPQAIPMHRVILDTPDGTEPDHINRNRLDNRRANLRPATRSQNIANKAPTSRNSSGYLGVGWCKKSRKWRAYISPGGKQRSLGRFADIVEAARAYDAAAREIYGNFAFLNFPDELPES